MFSGKQHLIPSRWRPGEIAVFEGALHRRVLSFDRSNPEPGQDDVHRQVRYPRGAQESLGLPPTAVRATPAIGRKVGSNCPRQNTGDNP